ncbi:glycosyltransferase family 2 protein [Janibacter sp. GS2]|uniref:glycosyltransferase family 2 protein n=1 Tax=Janibacter sp. GS2 TaxID=3442646 RepID=UPI003EBC0EF3
MDRTRLDPLALHLESVARMGVRHPDSTYPDLLARAATGGRLTAAALVDVARATASDPDRELPVALVDVEAICWLALARAALVGAAGDLDDICGLLRLAHRASGERGLGPRFRHLWLDALFLTRRTDEFPYPRDDHAPGGAGWRVRVDELNAAAGPGAAGPTGPGLVALSEVFTQHDLAPVHLVPGTGPPLSRVTATSTRRTDGSAPLVTIVMPVHDPGADLAFSLRSVLAQSWGHLEILLCDDGSTASSRAQLEEMAASDARVRLLRHPVNQGAYAARNLGLSHARGEFITFQDADDWSHPERIRLQVEALLTDPGPVASMSCMVRVDEHLALTVLGYPAESVNASSLLFRREPVLGRLGGFDSVRRAADNEFVGRLQAVFGRDSLALVPEILALVQRTPGSLSRDDQRLLFRDPSREHYRFCYRQWHGLIGEGRSAPFVRPPQRPPVPARHRVSGGPPEPEHRADLLLLGGFGPNSPTSPDIPSEVHALCDTGASVALLSFPSPTDLTVPARRPADPIVQRIRTGEATWVLPDESVVASVALVRDAAAVTHLEGVLDGVRPRVMVLVAGEDPEGRFDPAEIEERARRAPRTTAAASPIVRWLPATTSIAASLTEHVPPQHVLPPRVWGAVPAPDPSTWATSPDRPVGVLRPSALLAPTELTAWAATAVPRDPDTVLRCRTSGPRLSRRLGRPVESLRGTGTTRQEFFGQIAYLCVPPVPGRGAHLHPEAVRALGHGCVLVLHPSYREHFGPAALYTDERSVDEWIALHAGRPELYAQQQERAVRFLAERVSAAALRDTVGGLLTLAEPEDGTPAHRPPG